ncbi:MAG: glutamine-hydrolyzing GMP synthase [Candidatus Kerfeldbacteria bacterium]
MKRKHIAILDFGSQYMHLISRRVRQLGVLAKIYPTDVNAHDLKDAWGIILSGGPDSITEEKLPYDPGIFKLGKPMLGFCYGHQLMAKVLGGEVASQHNREYGKAIMTVEGDSPIFKGLTGEEQVWMSHWDAVTKVPEGFTIVGTTPECPVTAMANDTTKIYGFQYHPEVNHTTSGMKMLENFVFDICGAEKNWSMEEYFDGLKKEVKELVGKRNVFLLVSGGVDSSVAFALLEDILGKDRVFGLHVDTGFMRKNESALVKESLAAAGFDDLHVVDASDRFLLAVEGLVEPEEKRKKIGRIFLDVQKDVFDDLEFNQDEWLLGQGTIYPDTIEAGGTKASDVIKTHHNRVEEIVEMINQGRVVEPLSELYKDEVREIGRQLGLPDELVNRWPFPGPGLSIRCLCSEGKEAALEGRNQKQIDEISDIKVQIGEHLKKSGVEGQMLPLKSVGVQGDLRTYQHAVVVRDALDIEWQILDELAIRMVNNVQGVNRLVAHVGGDVDFENIALKEGYLTRDRLEILREADNVVFDLVQEHGLYDKIWQFPVIMLPLTFTGKGEMIVLRPIESQEAMTVNFYQMEKKVLKEMADEIMKIDGVDAVFFDITNKPPATIEWE